MSTETRSSSTSVIDKVSSWHPVASSVLLDFPCFCIHSLPYRNLGLAFIHLPTKANHQDINTKVVRICPGGSICHCRQLPWTMTIPCLVDGATRQFRSRRRREHVPDFVLIHSNSSVTVWHSPVLGMVHGCC
jgi:hypothetical protein